MKIISRSEFLNLTKPTIFSKVTLLEGQYIIEDDLNILYPSYYINDFEVLPLNISYNIECTDSSDIVEKIDTLEQGQSVNLEYDSIMRDGLFEDDIKFAIFEQKDLDRIKKVINSL